MEPRTEHQVSVDDIAAGNEAGLSAGKLPARTNHAVQQLELIPIDEVVRLRGKRKPTYFFAVKDGYIYIEVISRLPLKGLLAAIFGTGAAGTIVGLVLRHLT
jgi:hypothetical protein